MERRSLDELKTKQDFGRPESLTEEQEKDLYERTEEERQEFSDVPALSEDDVEELARVEETENIYLASTVQSPHLKPKMKEILEEIEEKFGNELEDGLIVIVSLTRIGKQQMKANPKIANQGTHPKGEAIDFAGKFMKEKFPESAETLENILNQMESEGKNSFHK